MVTHPLVFVFYMAYNEDNLKIGGSMGDFIMAMLTLFAGVILVLLGLAIAAVVGIISAITGAMKKGR